MKARAQMPMTVAEFLDWSDRQEGKYELFQGEVYAMAPGKIRHARSKAACWMALRSAIRRAGLPCEAFVDGPGIAITENSCYIPDASVHCGERASGDERLLPAPMIVVEVLSPSTARLDMRGKLPDYFSVASIQHYLVVDVERRMVLRHSRGEAGLIVTAILRDGDELRLDPPGMTLAVGEMFGEGEGE